MSAVLRSSIVFVYLVLIGCVPIPERPSPEPFTFTIDEAIEPSIPEVVGLDGGDPRPVAVIAYPNGQRMEFVANEVVYTPGSDADLQAFLNKYGGEVLRDGRPLLHPDTPVTEANSVSSGTYLIRITSSDSATDDLAENMEQAAIGGQHMFSSEDAARLWALVAREKQGVHSKIGPNPLVELHAILEHDDGAGGFLDAETWTWLTEDDNPIIPGDQGLSTGVLRAWRYLGYKDVPPDGLWSPPVIAIVDGGYDVDDAGVPQSAAEDFFPSVPMQLDMVDFDTSANGANLMTCGVGNPCPWHGQSVFGVAAAEQNNRFGGAGIGSRVAWAMLVRIDGTFFSVADAIRSAYLNGADVINLSLGGNCAGEACDLIRNQVLLATTGGTVVVASAGNTGNDLASDNQIPCETQNVICVGGVDGNGQNVFNFGTPVDIWAPGVNIATTITPLTAGQTGLNPLMFSGTSAAAPFLSGVISLMKALDPSLSVSEVLSILQDTANTSTDTTVAQGYVDAFRAVERVSPNQPPTAIFQIPTDGASVSHNREVYLHVDAKDPETGNSFAGQVAFSSNVDGPLCSVTGFATGCKGPKLSLGQHVITATVSDRFDASVTASITVTSINQLPVANITFPNDGDTFFTDQTINLRGYGFDWDEEITDDGLSWTSNIDGPLDSGEDILVTLSAGAHTITLVATDSLDLSGSDTLNIEVLPASGFPTALITGPSEILVFSATTPIDFVGEGTDPDDGVLSGASLTWSSNIDGVLGTGQNLTTTLSGAPDACDPLIPHTVTLTVVDSDGNSASHSINLLIGVIC